MSTLSYALLLEATHTGGPSALTERTHLRPAAGEEALVAPAKYATTKGGNGTYVYETRFVDGEPTRTVLIDSRTSVANRLEAALIQAIEDGHALLGRVPRIKVTYSESDPVLSFTDMELPHRAFDGHVRLGTHNGVPVTEDPTYRNARNATPANAFALLQLSPDTVIFGGWDSTRKAHQARFASTTVGEIIGVLANQEKPEPTRRSGARIDPLAPSFTLSKTDVAALAQRLGEDAGSKARKAKKASDFLIGAIPPGTDSLDGIATSSILRSQVLSFSTLRSLRFGKGAEGDAAIRALLAAIVLEALVRSDAELLLRANTHLVEKERPELVIDRRYGEDEHLDPLTIESADALFEEAFDRAEKTAGLDWNGQIYEVEGNPVIPGAAEATEVD